MEIKDKPKIEAELQFGPLTAIRSVAHNDSGGYLKIKVKKSSYGNTHVGTSVVATAHSMCEYVCMEFRRERELYRDEDVIRFAYPLVKIWEE